MTDNLTVFHISHISETVFQWNYILLNHSNKFMEWWESTITSMRKTVSETIST